MQIEGEKDKTQFVKEIEALLLKERDVRINNDLNASSHILLEIVPIRDSNE